MVAPMGRGKAFPRGAAAGLAALAGWGHVVYPLWLAVRTRDLRDAIPPEPTTWPTVSVVIPAYKESAVVAAKVANVLDNDYPGALEVIVVAEDAETAGAARTTPAIVIDNPQRLGKALSLNRGVAAASHERIVLTDADTRLAPGAIACVARWFDDPTVGAVAGEKRVAGRTGEALYWRFESWLKRRETRLGTTTGMSGGLVAVRKSGFQELPVGLIVDDFWVALDVIEAGRRVVYDAAARWSDESDREDLLFRFEWERRTRVVSGTLDIMWRRRRMLAPGQPVAFQLWGHRVIRSSVGPVAHVILVLMSMTRARRSRLAAAFFAGHLAAAVAFARRVRGDRLTMPERILSHLVLLQAVALGGTLRYLRGERPGLWPKDERRRFPLPLPPAG